MGTCERRRIFCGRFSPPEKERRFFSGGEKRLPEIRLRSQATGQGMVFWPRCPKQGVQFDLALS